LPEQSLEGKQLYLDRHQYESRLLGEIASPTGSRPSRRPPVLNADILFDRAEKNAEGKIDREGIGKLFRENFPNVNVDGILSTEFNIMDVNHDGAVSADEFRLYHERILDEVTPNPIEPKSTDDVRVDPEDLSKADRAFRTGPWYTEDDTEVMFQLSAYRFTTRLAGIVHEISVRAVPCYALGRPFRVACFLHGFTKDRTSYLWSKTWHAFRRDGFQIVTLEFPGWGRSSGEANQSRPWQDHDGMLLLRVLRAFPLPEQGACVSVIAEGIGAVAFIRAYAEDPRIFAAHHILLNVVIGDIPKEFKTHLRDRGADCFVYLCEKFYKDHAPLGANTFKGIFGFYCSNEVQSHNLMYLATLYVEGTGVGSFKVCTTRRSTFFTGAQARCRGIARDGEIMLFLPSSEAIDEFLDYLGAPPRRMERAFKLPLKTSVELGVKTDSVRVFVRVCPTLPREHGLGFRNCVEVTAEKANGRDPCDRITVRDVRIDNMGPRNERGTFVFQQVFDPRTQQEQVYNSMAKGLVAEFLTGTNVTVIAFGAIGTGKTYTMLGTEGDPGIVCRTVRDIFKSNFHATGEKLLFEYVHVTSDGIKDLLDPSARKELRVFEAVAGLRIEGAKSIEPPSAQELLAAFGEAQKWRPSARIGASESYSRTHAVAILRLGKFSRATEPHSMMFLADLAGSERLFGDSAPSRGPRGSSAGDGSTVALERVIAALVENEGRKRAFIPYNLSELTSLLRVGLGGNSKTSFLACISRTEDCLTDTLSTLRLAMHATHIKNAVITDERLKLEAEFQRIRASAQFLPLDAQRKGTMALHSGTISCYANLSAGVDAPLVVLLHGEPDPAAEHLVPMGEYLSSKGFRWLAPSMPGFGDSPGTKLPTKLEALKEEGGCATIVAEILDFLGITTAHLFGTNWGASLACMTAVAYPQRVDKVLINVVDPEGNFMSFWPLAEANDHAVVALRKKTVGLFWSLMAKGKHDPHMTSFVNRCVPKIQANLRTKLYDTYAWSHDEFSQHFFAFLAKA